MRLRLLCAVLAVAAACTSSPDPDRAADPPRPADRAPEEAPAIRPISLLQQADDCDEALERLQGSLRREVGPFGFGGRTYPFDGWLVRAGDARRTQAAVMLSASYGAQAAAPEHSTTNVQEAGVDEADVVETDGERILALVRSRLIYVDVTGTPRRRGEVTLPDGERALRTEMFLDGDRALVFQTGWEEVDESAPAPRRLPADISWIGGRATTTVSVVDVGDPDELEVTDRFTVDGEYQSARMVDGVARIVVASQPADLPWLMPQSSTEEAMEAATEANRKVIDESTLADWLPQIRRGEDTERATACDQVFVPRRFAGAGMINVLTVPVADELDPRTVSVQGSSQVVYASADHLYVAAPSWVEPPERRDGASWSNPPPTTSDVHRFSLADPGTATYEVSGRVDGTVLDQFSLSEHDGYLRVATTDGPPWSWDGTSASNITVLHERDGQLVRRGKVGDMGRGEQITSVRYDGDRAYVVTFRQIDPFYVVDLSDPAEPRVAGELELPGFSSYLHPIGDDLVIGVGQDATDAGMTRGTKVSLFDVSDPSAPQEVGRWTKPGATSTVEEDHRAFLWWPDTQQLVVPIWGPPDVNGAVVLGVDGTTLTEAGAVRQVAVERSLVVGDTLWTYSGFGVVGTDLDTMQDTARISFN